MPKYWRKQIFAHGRFHEVGPKQKTEGEKKKREEERLNDGNNNGQLFISTPPRVVHANPPGPIQSQWKTTLMGGWWLADWSI